MKKDPTPVGNDALDDRDRQELLRIARATLREHLSTGYLPPGSPHRRSLLRPAGAFVTVKVAGSLRGCMGRVEADKPLYLAVEELTVAASTRDPRFEPVRTEELKDTRLTVSVLSAPEPTQPEGVLLGIHGIVITKGPRRGLLLPSVATEHKLTVEQFLDETCAKAGLPRGAWRDPSTQVGRFTADSFSEPDA
jgi:AmmeMemoRadiSam system protein A